MFNKKSNKELNEKLIESNKSIEKKLDTLIIINNMVLSSILTLSNVLSIEKESIKSNVNKLMVGKTKIEKN